MHLNEELTTLRDAGVCTFEEVDIGGRMIAIVLPDGRRNVLPYAQSVIARGARWTNFAEDVETLSRLTGPNAIEIATTLLVRIRDELPDITLKVDGFEKRPERPVRFLSRAGAISVRGGFPIHMGGVEAEARRIVSAHADARRAVDAEIASWRTTTMDACYVVVAAGMSGLDGGEFFERIARDPARVEGVVGDNGEAVAAAPRHELDLPGGLVVRVQGRSITATMKTSAYTFDACKLIVKNAPQLPETLLSAIRGRPLDALIDIPGLDGSELTVDRIKAERAGKKLQMTVRFAPRPLRMTEARELYDRIRTRTAAIHRVDTPDGVGERLEG